MAKKNLSKQKKMDTRVNFTPMVDMMMLLITFFMLCTTLAKPQAMQLTMPSNDENLQKEDKQVTKASHTITLYLGANDKIYYVAGLPNYDDPASCVKETTYGKDGIEKVLNEHTTEEGINPVAKIKVAKKDHHYFGTCSRLPRRYSRGLCRKRRDSQRQWLLQGTHTTGHRLQQT